MSPQGKLSFHFGKKFVNPGWFLPTYLYIANVTSSIYTLSPISLNQSSDNVTPSSNKVLDRKAYTQN